MKTLLMSLSILCAASLTAQTTLDEYNYVVQGYDAQLRHGLPNKPGYSFEELDKYGLKFGNTDHMYHFKGLKKEGQEKYVAIMVIHKKTNVETNVTESDYYCIPHNNSAPAIWTEALTKIHNTNDVNLLKALTWALMKYTARIGS